ncbi:MAG: hypothetical protein WDO73_22715 [Ignavibacteriota bacterium]
MLEHSGRVGVQIRPHDARRTFARLAFYGGSGMEQVSLSLGHSSVTVTERYIGVRLDLADAPATTWASVRRRNHQNMRWIIPTHG